MNKELINFDKQPLLSTNDLELLKKLYNNQDFLSEIIIENLDIIGQLEYEIALLIQHSSNEKINDDFYNLYKEILSKTKTKPLSKKDLINKYKITNDSDQIFFLDFDLLENFLGEIKIDKTEKENGNNGNNGNIIDLDLGEFDFIPEILPLDYDDYIEPTELAQILKWETVEIVESDYMIENLENKKLIEIILSAIGHSGIGKEYYYYDENGNKIVFVGKKGITNKKVIVDIIETANQSFEGIDYDVLRFSDFVSLIFVESKFNPTVRSISGCSGLCQLSSLALKDIHKDRPKLYPLEKLKELLLNNSSLDLSSYYKDDDKKDKIYNIHDNLLIGSVFLKGLENDFDFRLQNTGKVGTKFNSFLEDIKTILKSKNIRKYLIEGVKKYFKSNNNLGFDESLFDEKKANQLLDRIILDENYLKKYRIFVKYNSDSRKYKGTQYRFHYAFLVMYLSDFVFSQDNLN